MIKSGLPVGDAPMLTLKSGHFKAGALAAAAGGDTLLGLLFFSLHQSAHVRYS